MSATPGWKERTLETLEPPSLFLLCHIPTGDTLPHPPPGALCNTPLGALCHTPLRALCHTLLRALCHTPLGALCHIPLGALCHTPLGALCHTPPEALSHTPPGAAGRLHSHGGFLQAASTGQKLTDGWKATLTEGRTDSLPWYAPDRCAAHLSTLISYSCRYLLMIIKYNSWRKFSNLLYQFRTDLSRCQTPFERMLTIMQ